MQRLRLLAIVPLLLTLGACNRDPHAKAVRYVENGNKFFEREKYKEASIMYRRAVAPNADPRYGEGYYRLGLTFLKLGAPGDAYRSFVRAVELQPENADARVKAADIELMAGAQGGQQGEQLLDQVRERATQLLGMKDGSYDGHRLLGQLSLLKGQPAEAVKQFEQANSIKPDQAPLILAYFTALVQNDQFPAAEKLARDLLAKQPNYSPMYDLLYVEYAIRKQFDLGEQVLRTKIEQNPKSSQYVLQLAAHYGSTQQREKMEETIRRLGDEQNFLDGHLVAGDFYFLQMREFERAREQYEAGMRAFPKEKLTYQKRMVELYVATNRPTEANKLLQTVLEEAPNDSDAQAMRAAMRLNTGDRDEVNLAATELQNLVTKTPGNHTFRFSLGRALLAKGDVDQAQVQLEEALKLRPDFVGARELLARVFLARNDGGKALQEAEAILKLDANSLTGHLIRSSALLLLGERQKARQELDFIIRNYPQNAEARYQVGYLAWEDKDYAKASQLFGELYKANPKDLRGLVGMVETLAGQNRMPEAVRQIEAAAAAEPDRRDLKLAVANMYVRAARYDEAITKYNEILSKDPTAADILFKLAETYRRKGDLNLAIDTFRKSSQAAPNDAAPLLQLGLLMDGVGRRAESKPIYEQILRINQDHPIALNNLAFIKAEEGADLDSALAMAQRAYQAVPSSADIADTLGWVYIRKNLSQEAVRIFTDLVRQHPNNAMYRYHYGMALMQKGDRSAARRELEVALRNQPSKDDAAKIEELLRQL